MNKRSSCNAEKWFRDAVSPHSGQNGIVFLLSFDPRHITHQYFIRTWPIVNYSVNEIEDFEISLTETR